MLHSALEGSQLRLRPINLLPAVQLGTTPPRPLSAGDRPKSKAGIDQVLGGTKLFLSLKSVSYPQSQLPGCGPAFIRWLSDCSYIGLHSLPHGTQSSHEGTFVMDGCQIIIVEGKIGGRDFLFGHLADITLLNPFTFTEC